MKSTLCIAVAVMVESPDDTLGVCAPLPKSPLEELAERLWREACYGRDCCKPGFARTNTAACTTAACREYND